MSPANMVKTALVAAGLLTFLFGIRLGHEFLRWTGIALVAIAWLLRFVPSGARPTGNTPSSSEDPP